MTSYVLIIVGYIMLTDLRGFGLALQSMTNCKDFWWCLFM